MSKNYGGYAFPYEYTHYGAYGESREVEVGLTVRDYIAIKCLPTLMLEMKNNGYGVIAEHAYLMADRMIEERERKD